MKQAEKAFLWITDILERNSVPYRISGGFAARVYGSRRELADIDIQVLDSDITRIENEVKPHIVYGPARYEDENWNLNLMTLQYLGQEIDIASTDAKFFNQHTRMWEKWVTDFTDVTMREVFGKKVPLEPKASLIVYKTKLGREVDSEDVQQLNATLTNVL